MTTLKESQLSLLSAIEAEAQGRAYDVEQELKANEALRSSYQIGSNARILSQLNTTTLTIQLVGFEFLMNIIQELKEKEDLEGRKPPAPITLEEAILISLRQPRKADSVINTLKGLYRYHFEEGVFDDHLVLQKIWNLVDRGWIVFTPERDFVITEDYAKRNELGLEYFFYFTPSEKLEKAMFERAQASGKTLDRLIGDAIEYYFGADITRLNGGRREEDENC